MPPRVARSSLPSSQPAKSVKPAKNPRKAAKRALNAFSIAHYENPEKLKISSTRLGQVDQSFQRKRPRDDQEQDDDDDDQDGEPTRRKRRAEHDTFDEGSDSDGNTWTMGHIDVDDDDDEDIDSDEAFGESDEERFEDFTFRGSSTNNKGRPKPARRAKEQSGDDGDFGLDEADSTDGDEEDDDLGEDAIDLATALDQYEEEEAEERQKQEKRKQKKNDVFAFDDSDESPSEEEDMAADGASDFTSDDDDEARQAQLKNLISSLATEEDNKPKGRRVDIHESAVPDEFGVSRKVDLLSFKPKVVDDEKKRALKLLQDNKSSKRKDIARKLDAPLPKRQQDKIDRAAANAKANETLERWTDTIKSNRRAENLMFPLQHKDGGADTIGEKRLQPTTTDTPANDLESTIQSILQQSGLSNGKEDEDKMQKWEELQTNKLPIDQVMKRRAQLRMERELLFREEIRAKRIKKIKSKAYRRVHRKEREKLLEKERSQLKADGVDLSEEEREYNDRRRAEERMGAKHRESKWAKGIKATGRAAWDKDALDGVFDMARRNDELRRRIEGKTVRDEDEDNSDLHSDDESEEDSDANVQQSLGKLKSNLFMVDNSTLGSMAFMQKAEAARRAQNDQDIERMRRELAGEESGSEEERENATKVGRRRYGPGKDMALPAIQINRNEFEEHSASDDEEPAQQASGGQEDPTAKGPSNGSRKSANSSSNESLKNKRKPPRQQTGDGFAETALAHNPFLTKAKKEKKSAADDALLPQLEDAAAIKSKAKASSKPHAAQETTVDAFLQQRVAVDDDGWATVLGGQDDDDADDQDGSESEGIDLDLVMRNQALTAKGFAGDNVVAEFDAEKKTTIQEEESTEIVNHLPGWGAWTGEGMTAAQKARNKGYKIVTKREGIDANKRKDKKLDKVIINERRQKSTTKYMASQLPFPFENKEQYERSLRVPKGKEWTTKKTFQDATRPRVIVKQGIIAPLRKPLV